MHKEIHNSQLPFWFHKLIQSHMCYTGLELEHCKLYLESCYYFSMVGYKKEQATEMMSSEFHQHTVPHPPPPCKAPVSQPRLFKYQYPIIFFFCLFHIFRNSHRSEAHTEYSSYIYKNKKRKK